ncbi:endonuclease/exonuclease/phosphatase family protein, partial [Candidatus Dojkabacteria bacterium]|nr:endonuclease/exonuclease/phosphatase family protein [Candidatus Dojkabacteria bacterium]
AHPKFIILKVFLSVITLFSIIGFVTFLVRNSQAPEESLADAPVELRILSYNLAAGLPSRNPNYSQFIGKVADFIIDNQVDIIAFQEIRLSERDTHMLQDDLESKGYAMNAFITSRGIEVNGHVIANAIFSRYPIGATEVKRFDNITHGTNDHVIQIAEILVEDDYALTFVNHHPQPAESCDATKTYFNQFLETTTTIDSKEIFIAGDYNMQRKQECYAILSQNFMDSCSESEDTSCLITADPTSAPQLDESIGIDYIFYESELYTTEVVSSDHSILISDHYPLLGRFSLIPTPTPTSTNIPSPSVVPSVSTLPSATASPTLSVSPTTSATPVSSPPNLSLCKPMDQNEDTIISIFDFPAFKNSYGSSCEYEIIQNPCGSQDTNIDGEVDIFDFKNFVELYRQGACT